MGGGFDSNRNNSRKLGPSNETCVYETIRTDFPLCHAQSASREQPTTTRLPEIRSPANKRDASLTATPKTHGPWGDAKETKDQVQEALRFPRICRKWSPPANSAPFFRLTDGETSLRLPSNVLKDTQNIRCSNTVPTPNPILLPIDFMESQNSGEKRLRTKGGKRAKSETTQRARPTSHSVGTHNSLDTNEN
ncbi:hypothetical protein EG68_10823 [Paragonimus skrjabini miyazakii]|uniref:Uncharacterized protein n=1 Tax=Paragonimus skrjabini miyazakii TaxID=59628 RepID=A0A8S9YEI6_9TREM|nr:hypothetical protein EG68_10823 [Paragonimus skrjabini miyazakii]